MRKIYLTTGWLVGAGALALVGCSSSSSSSSDAGLDATPASDSAADTSKPGDSGKDTGTTVDATADTGSDTGTTADTGTDTGTADAGTDAATDTGTTDAGSDTGTADGGSDAVADAGAAIFPVFLDNYAANAGFAPFGGSNNVVSVDTTVFHDNTASLKFVIPTTGYTGGAIALPTANAADLSKYNALSVWAKIDTAGPFQLDKIGLGNDATTANFAFETPALQLTSTWQHIILPIPDPSLFTAATGLFHFATGSQAAPQKYTTVWFADIEYVTVDVATLVGTPSAAIADTTAAPVTVNIASTKAVPGQSITYTLAATPTTYSTVGPYWFSYTSDTPAVATVSATTGIVTGVTAGTAKINAMLAGVAAAGTYEVTVPPASGFTVPAAAPTAPSLTTHPGSNVIALYDSSGVYTAANSTLDAVSTWRTSWSVGAEADYTVTGTAAVLKEYTGLQYAGVDFGSVNVTTTGMTHLHADVWTPNGTQFGVKFGVMGGAQVQIDYTSATIVKGQWISLDVPLATLPAAANGIISELLWVDNQGGNLEDGTFFIDNVYFWK